jgi:hypothetical protein
VIAWLAAAWAADPVVDGVADELQRGVAELRLPDSPPPYAIQAQVLSEQQVQIEAMLGGIVTRATSPLASLQLTVRAGSPERDNTNFEVWPTGSTRAGLPIEPSRLAARQFAWLAVDRAYKGSVEALAAKVAADQRRAEPDDVPDYAPGPPQQAESPPPPPFDEDALADLARELSAVFLRHPDLEWSRVWIDGHAGHRASLDTAGTRVVEPRQQLVVRVVGRARAPDGESMADQVLYVVRSADQLPPRDRMVADVDELCARLEAFRAAPKWSEDYVGPVLFEGEAATELVRELLAPALAGTPPPQKPPRGSRVAVFGGDREEGGPITPRRRALPDGWSLVDDPQRDPTLASSYRYDLEGEPARRVELVRDGITVGHLMSRTPNQWFTGSNGHGTRGQNIARAAAADLELTAPRVASDRSLRKTALKEAARYGFDWFLVVRVLQDPALDPFSGGSWVDFADWFGVSSPRSPTTVVVSRVYADGHEEAFRGVELGGLGRDSFKELLAGGAPTVRTMLDGQANFFTGPNAGDPLTVRSPSLLLGEVVVQPIHGSSEKPPRLPSPVAGG